MRAENDDEPRVRAHDHPSFHHDALPVDSDVSPDDPGLHHRILETLHDRWDVLLVIGAGGALGSLARWGLSEAVVRRPAGIAWSTMIANVSGAFALGVLMVLVFDIWPSSRYLRPFVGVGLLGGFTTFSTYMLDTRTLLAEGEAAAAAGSVVLTLFLGLAAVWLGMVGGQIMFGPMTKATDSSGDLAEESGR